MRIPPKRTLALALAALLIVSGFLMTSNQETMAKWAKSTSTSAVALNFGQLNVNFTERKRALMPYVDVVNPMTFGIGVLPQTVAISVHPDASSFSTDTELSDFLFWVSADMSIAGYPDANCTLGTQNWSTPVGAITNDNRTGTITTSAFPVQKSSTVVRCLRVLFNNNQPIRSFYEQFAGREFRLTMTYRIATPGNASWSGTKTYHAKYVIPVPAPKAPTGVGSTLDRSACTVSGGDVRLFWRWPDQTSTTSTVVPGLDHWGFYIRRSGTTAWTFLRNQAGDSRNRSFSAWWDMNDVVSVNGDYEIRLVAFPFANEGKYVAATNLWRVRRLDGSNWACGFAGSPTVHTSAYSEAPFGYDVTFPAYPDLMTGSA